MRVMAQDHSRPGVKPPRRIEACTGGQPRDLRDINHVAVEVKGGPNAAPQTPNQFLRG